MRKPVAGPPVQPPAPGAPAGHADSGSSAASGAADASIPPPAQPHGSQATAELAVRGNADRDRAVGDAAATHAPVIHVAIGLLRDARGRVLLARRRADQHLPGLWEFPGGKLAPGETPAGALARELAEECGVRATTFAPWMRLRRHYPASDGHDARTVVLHALRVGRWSGRVAGREGQALRWAEVAELDRLPMPAANAPLIASLKLPAVYQISGPCRPGGQADFLRRIEYGLARGVTLVCLRCPDLPDAPYAALARAVMERAAGRAQVLVHDRAHLVAATGAHGVHLSARGAAALPARPASGWLGVSCHDAAELAVARTVGADFAVLGPVRPTASHPGASTLGWAAFAALCADAGLPVYALGGLTPAGAARARRAGAQGVAVLGALWSPPPAAQARPV